MVNIEVDDKVLRILEEIMVEEQLNNTNSTIRFLIDVYKETNKNEEAKL